MIFGDGPRFLRQFPGIDDEQKKLKKDLVEHLKTLCDIAGPVKFTDEAEAYHKEVYESGKLTQEVVNKDYVVCVTSNMGKCDRTGFNGCNVNGP